jgi:inosine-uridine nucleoside N-ribohydrolase
MTRKVLFDTDPGCDDAVMLAMALGHDAVDVVGLSTVCGNSTVANTTRNALAILDHGGFDVPVARGCERPLVGDLTTAEWIHGDAGLRGDLPDPTSEPIDQHGADFIVEQAREHGDELTIAAVGPQTNLALALATEPTLPEMVDDIYLMGGTAFERGNVTPVAEANFHNDPAAASRVIQDADAKMVGLDVTNGASPAPETIDTYDDRGGGFGVVADWIGYPEAAQGVGQDELAVHDAAVAADLIDPGVLTFEEYFCEVDTTGGPSHGAVVCDQYGVRDADPNTAVAVDMDLERFRSIFRSGIEGYATAVDPANG